MGQEILNLRQKIHTGKEEILLNLWVVKQWSRSPGELFSLEDSFRFQEELRHKLWSRAV